MRKLEKNTRRYFVNLFADYILSKFNKSENTIIQIPNENDKNIYKKSIIYFKYLHKTYFSKEEVVFDPLPGTVVPEL